MAQNRWSRELPGAGSTLKRSNKSPGSENYHKVMMALYHLAFAMTGIYYSVFLRRNKCIKLFKRHYSLGSVTRPLDKTLKASRRNMAAINLAGYNKNGGQMEPYTSRL